MTHAHRRILAAATASLLLTACSSSPTPETHISRPTVHAADTTSSAGVPATDKASSADAAAGTTAPATPTSGVQACSLVTEREATAALGRDPGVGVGTSRPGASSCAYGTYRARSIVTVNLVPVSGKADFDHLRRAAPTGQIADVAGVGDAAFGVSQGPSASVWFTKGDTLVAVAVLTGAGAPPTTQATILARSAASRI